MAATPAFTSPNSVQTTRVGGSKVFVMVVEKSWAAPKIALDAAPAIAKCRGSQMPRRTSDGRSSESPASVSHAREAVWNASMIERGRMPRRYRSGARVLGGLALVVAEEAFDLGGEFVAVRHPVLAGEPFQALKVLTGVVLTLDQRVHTGALADGLLGKLPER